MRELPRLVGLRACGNAGRHPAVVKTDIAFQLRPEDRALLGRGDPGGQRSPIHVGQAVVGDQPAFGMQVLGKVVLDPELGQEVLLDSVGQVLVAAGRGFIPEDSVQRRNPPKSVHCMALGDTIRLVPCRTLQIVAGSFDSAFVGSEGSQVIGGKVDRPDLRRQPAAVKRVTVDDIRVLDIGRVGQRGQRIAGHPVLIEAAVVRVGLQLAGRGLLACVGREDGQRQFPVRSLERADVVPVCFDDVHLTQPKQGVGHLVSVQRRVGIAVAKSLAVCTDRPIAGEDLRVDGGQHVLDSRSLVRGGDFGIGHLRPRRDWFCEQRCLG